ncbi:kynurenine--oxoglutarate transaminase 3 isoform X2 [Tetranychus urticae]|uniref:kynurenine--oxoglutarate transaminase 3 isoform X2 n=1 Tax=Tetranychus urticae TaxID=32264 RepID=UPI00077B92F0|nr:kynurenine--oxoglutarate transaminase 3 isoform X2 [Tetranychus urticae]
MTTILIFLILSSTQVIRTMSANSDSIKSADRLEGHKLSVWNEFIQLATDHKPVNLGQGFPDYPAPSHVTKALVDVQNDENILLQQYTRGFGHPRLVKALSKLYSMLIERPVDPNNHVLVTVGAYEALYCSIMAWVNPGDEVIIIEPFFDCYKPMVELAGGKPVFIPLRPPTNTSYVISSGDWKLDMTELEHKFSNKTKMIIVNTPHNPLGKVFTREELTQIADLCKKYNVIALMDEVYEWIIFNGKQHVRMASFPDMWDRTITVGSAGKTFSLTGWKIGWAYGSEKMIRPLQLIHQNSIYVCATPLQEAIARGFETEIANYGTNKSYWKELSDDLQEKRDEMVQVLTAANMNPTIPEGGYFLLADFSELANRVNYSSITDGTKDYRFTKWLIIEKKLQGIPPSVFYSEDHQKLVENFIRFCFFKKPETLAKAGEIIKKL